MKKFSINENFYKFDEQIDIRRKYVDESTNDNLVDDVESIRNEKFIDESIDRIFYV